MSTSQVLHLSPSPHIHTRRTTSGAMRHVLAALLPAVGCALYYFGLPALLTLVISSAAAMLTEWAITLFLLKRPSTLGDCSALLTGILLALNLPASLPWWITAAGAVFAIAIAKMAFGGLGCNIFNPALTGRVFLLISFPAAMTAWTLPTPGFGDADGVTGATLLSQLKESATDIIPDATSLLSGNMGGSMGETCAAAIIIGFIYLIATGTVRWHIPAAIVAGMALIDLFAGFPLWIDLLSGGLLLGAVFMATDYVTSPMTRSGMLLYGLLIGIITASIRRWGIYPEGMSFAILIMNGATPLINRYMRPTRFSPRRKEATA